MSETRPGFWQDLAAYNAAHPRRPAVTPDRHERRSLGVARHYVETWARQHGVARLPELLADAERRPAMWRGASLDELAMAAEQYAAEHPGEGPSPRATPRGLFG